jgi:MbtH protein
MSNPFEDEKGVYVALMNAEGQFSLWPQFAPVPAGWNVAFGPDSRARCLAYVEAEWVDMRPRSVVAARRQP